MMKIILFFFFEKIKEKKEQSIFLNSASQHSNLHLVSLKVFNRPLLDHLLEEMKRNIEIN